MSEQSGCWSLPPLAALVVGVFLIAAGEIGGAAMVRFNLDLTRWARGVMLTRPATHALVGVRDVDEGILDRAIVKFDGGLRLFHLHAEGMGLVIIAATTVSATFVAAGVSRRAIIALLTIGGAGYPAGYLLWSALIPYLGVDAGKVVAERCAWIPFGGAVIVAMWWLAAVLARRLCKRRS